MCVAIEVIVFLLAAGIILVPMLLPSGVIVKSEERLFEGTLTTYERVGGLRAFRHWWNGDLEPEPAVDGVHTDPPLISEVVDIDEPRDIILRSRGS
jgi:hypothetical protein